MRWSEAVEAVNAVLMRSRVGGWRQLRWLEAVGVVGGRGSPQALFDAQEAAEAEAAARAEAHAEAMAAALAATAQAEPAAAPPASRDEVRSSNHLNHPC